MENEDAVGAPIPKSQTFYEQNIFGRMSSTSSSKATTPNSDNIEGKPPKTANKETEVAENCATNKNGNKRYLVIEDAPKSLSFLVKFYRFFGFSFTGLVFESDDEEDEAVEEMDETASSVHAFDIDEVNEARMNKAIRSSARFHPERYLYVLFNLACLMFNVGMLIFTSRSNLNLPVPPTAAPINETQMVMTILESDRSKLINWEAIETLANKLTDNSGTIEMTKLKPIIRTIIESLTYVFVLDNCLNSAYNLVFGGHLICKINEIMNVRLLDRDNRLAKKLILRCLLVIFMMNLVLTVSFGSDYIKVLIEMATKNVNQNEAMAQHLPDVENSLWVMLSRYILHLVQCINLTLFPNLFIYAMQMFKRNIQMVNGSVEMMPKNLNEANVMDLKEKLTELNDQFKAITFYFSIPITISFASNTFMVIGAACFMMISQGNDRSILTFIGNIGLLAFFRLVMISYAGGLPTNACRRLMRTIYEHLHDWELNNWICFMEMKQLRKEFVVSVFSTYRIRQASVLTMLGFALNYIVILLQTESSITDIATVSTNGTINATTSVVN